MPDWDKDSPELSKSLTHILSEMIRDAGDRVLPTRELARQWQQGFLEGLDVPDPNYRGSYRGEEGLERVWVTVGDLEGMAPFQVSKALTQFEADLQRSIAEMDTELGVGQELDADQLGSVLDLCAWAHAEWIRIHPFANGNGRTARLWANWIAVRYGLPPFVRLRPRPSDGYAAAGVEAMKGNWLPTVEVFQELLMQCISESR